MLGLITEITVKATYWLLYQTYCGLHYLYYGRQPTSEELTALKLDEIENENKRLQEKIDHLENLIKDQRDSSNEQSTRSVPVARGLSASF